MKKKYIFSHFRRLRKILCLWEEKEKRTKKKGGRKKKNPESVSKYGFQRDNSSSLILPSFPSPFLTPPSLCVLKLQPKDLEAFQRSVTNEDHMCSAPLVQSRTKPNCKSLLSTGQKSGFTPILRDPSTVYERGFLRYPPLCIRAVSGGNQSSFQQKGREHVSASPKHQRQHPNTHALTLLQPLALVLAQQQHLHWSTFTCQIPFIMLLRKLPGVRRSQQQWTRIC